MKKVILLLILMGAIKSSYGMSARQLHEECNRDPGSCIMYMSGFFTGIQAAFAFPIKFSDGKISVGTLKNLFAKEMYLYPQLGDLEDSVVMTKLLVKQGVLKETKK